jgi:poly(A) polymerase
VILPEILQIVKNQLRDNEKCFLVGGAVRDHLLGRNVKDFDFSTSSDPRSLARKIADVLHGNFYVMDEARRTSRVIFPIDKLNNGVIDVSALQGDLLEDLQGRDFTINAMAIDLQDSEKIIDPLKGGRDLQEKWLRLCNNSSFKNDPVRVIRAVRYAIDLGLRIEPNTTVALKESVDLLNRISLERKRDEFFKIIQHNNSFPAILLLQKFQILSKLNLGPTAEHLDQYRIYELFQKILSSPASERGTGFFIAATFLSAFTGMVGDLSSYFSRQNSACHTGFQLGKFALLASKGMIESSVDPGLLSVFSREEKDIVEKSILFEKTIYALLLSEDSLDHRNVYRLHVQIGQPMIDILMMCLAGIASKPAAELDQQEWLSVVTRAADLLDICFHHPEIIHPKPLVNGDEIISGFQIPPGPLIGLLLNGLKEEQAAGVITKHEDALNWLENQIRQVKAS